mmetsp:Transcript_5957/g.14750  ORF Transcript_5957/g.14750 Transcript_5957/m.14750 type:complete len:291 (+) Transcript_5957:295-1167(+)
MSAKSVAAVLSVKWKNEPCRRERERDRQSRQHDKSLPEKYTLPKWINRLHRSYQEQQKVYKSKTKKVELGNSSYAKADTTTTTTTSNNNNNNNKKNQNQNMEDTKQAAKTTTGVQRLGHMAIVQPFNKMDARRCMDAVEKDRPPYSTNQTFTTKFPTSCLNKTILVRLDGKYRAIRLSCTSASIAGTLHSSTRTYFGTKPSQDETRRSRTKMKRIFLGTTHASRRVVNRRAGPSFHFSMYSLIISKNESTNQIIRPHIDAVYQMFQFGLVLTPQSPSTLICDKTTINTNL